MRISFLTSGHEPFDERIFYHMAVSLSENGEKVEIVSSKLTLEKTVNDIKLNCFAGHNIPKREKIRQFNKKLEAFGPDLIICSEPLPLLAAKKYSDKHTAKIKIVYDITEWYPSKKNLSIYKPIWKWFYFLKLLIFNLSVSNFADAFLFGEFYKGKIYRFVYPRKPYYYLTYYPDLKYIDFIKPELLPNKLRLNYSGKINTEKGIENFIKLLNKIAEANLNLKIEAKIIGWYETLNDKEYFEGLIQTLNRNITLLLYEKQSFPDFIKLIKDADIFIDLRSDDFENQHCLPIKLFYYAALGRPVIYSDLKAIKKEVAIDMFGFLVQPENIEQIKNIILTYIRDSDLYNLHCTNARKLVKIYYNWNKIKPGFLKFINAISSF